MLPDQFRAYVPWPRKKFYYSGVDPTDEAGPSTFVDEHFNTELDEFLGRKE